MTTQHAGYLVVLEQDIRKDDAEGLINALRHIRGVLTVTPVESDYELVVAQSRANAKWYDKINNILTELRKDAWG